MSDPEVVEFYNPGEIIYEAKHIAHVIYHIFRKEYCDYCCIRNVNVRLCSKCHYVGYCDSQCQKSAWPDHRLECSKMDPLLTFIDRDAVLLVARIIRKLKNEPGKPRGKNGLLEKSIASLSSFTGSKDPHFTLIQERYFKDVFASVKGWLKNDKLKLKSKEIEDFCSKIIYNKRSMYYDKEYGTFFHLGVCDFKRGCLPNAVDILNSKLTVEIRATQKIPKGDLKEVCLHNINIMSFYSSHAFTSDLIHHSQKCYTCQSQAQVLAFRRLMSDPVAFNIVIQSETLSKRISNYPSQGDPDPLLRNAVDMGINSLKQYMANTELVGILRLKLLIWKVLLDRQTLFIVKNWERSVINLMRSLYGEQSFELYTVYSHLTAIYLEYKKFKFAKGYKVKSDELGALYGLPPRFTDEDFEMNTS